MPLLTLWFATCIQGTCSFKIVFHSKLKLIVCCFRVSNSRNIFARCVSVWRVCVQVYLKMQVFLHKKRFRIPLDRRPDRYAPNSVCCGTSIPFSACFGGTTHWWFFFHASIHVQSFRGRRPIQIVAKRLAVRLNCRQTRTYDFVKCFRILQELYFLQKHDKEAKHYTRRKSSHKKAKNNFCDFCAACNRHSEN